MSSSDIKPQWWSEPVAATGSAKSDGIRRQLGAPRMDPLTVLVRESAQNSWDARLPEAATVYYGIDLRRLDAQQATNWRSVFAPEPSGSKLGIDSLLEESDAVLATISDRGTAGLGGPIRADEVPEGATDADFVNLLRNIGEPRDKEFGGGTYGFGKGVLYTSSLSSTILVRTRCRTASGLQTRLIGAALGIGFHRERRAYTGRHWWADLRGGIPDPFLDDEADLLSSFLGLPPMLTHETGTDIVLLGLNLGSTPALVDGEAETPRTLEEAADHLASTIMWNLWPLMLRTDAPAPLRCHVTVDGRDVAVPDPEQEPCIFPFVDAYRTAANQPVILSRKRPKADLGVFAASKHLAPSRPSRATVAAPFTGNAHHCARMREPRLVVDYVEGPLLADDILHYGAIFIANREHDKAFADSEPPTHDDWVPQNVEGDARSLVNCTLKEIKAELLRFADSVQGLPVSGGTQPPLGALANRLAALLPSAAGPAADGDRTGSPGSGGQGSAAKVRMVTQPRMVRLDDKTMITADLEVAPSANSVNVTTSAAVALDIGNESEPPAGADVPTVREYRSRDGRTVAGPVLVVEPHDERRWTVVIQPVAGAAVKVRVTAV